MRAGLAVLAAIAAVALVAEPVSAYRFAGERWPNQTISVGSRAPLYHSAVRTAIRAWNRAHVGVRFTRAPVDRARVIFGYTRRGGSGRYGCEGIAGGTGAGYPSPFLAMHVSVLRSCRSQALRRLTAVHELGHVLGLGHETRRCALMNPTGDVNTLLPSLCPRGTRLPARDDIRGARALYRRRPAAVSDTIALFNPGPGTRIPMPPARCACPPPRATLRSSTAGISAIGAPAPPTAHMGSTSSTPTRTRASTRSRCGCSTAAPRSRCAAATSSSSTSER